MANMDSALAKALKELKKYLLTPDLQPHIAKIILFGSHARGGSKRSSDVDLLIITTNGKMIKKDLMDRIYDLMMAHQLPIEVVFSNIDDLFPIRDYFTYNILRYGIEVYSMKDEEIKKEALKNLINLGIEYLESAEDAFSRDHIRLALDGAYNAAEIFAKALILKKQEDLPGSHGGVVTNFGRLYISSNEIDKEIGRGLNMALSKRNEARYKPLASLGQEDVSKVIDLARSLLKIAKVKIE